MELEFNNFELELKFPTKKLNPQINLPFNFFNSEIFLPWQSYLEYKLLRVGIPSRYSEYLLMVKRVIKKWNWNWYIWNWNCVEFKKWNWPHVWCNSHKHLCRVIGGSPFKALCSLMVVVVRTGLSIDYPFVILLIRQLNALWWWTELYYS